MRELELQQRSELASGVVLPLPSFVPRRYRPGAHGNWSGHLPFANDLIAQQRPSLLVELGTHYGESYFGMCQSVLENGIDCVCYAVDHWHGEEHAGRYGEEVFEEVRDYNDRFYKSFSYLLRASFEEAVEHFQDETIELLHIDGLHTYEAGGHDFRSWFPKVKPGGTVLLHDVMVRHANFGIYKLWEELTEEFPDTFTFHHAWGLGVLEKPGGRSNRGPWLRQLFHANPEERERIRRHYVLYASYLDRMLAAETGKPAVTYQTAPAATGSEPEAAHIQIFCPVEGKYSEDLSLKQRIVPGDWHSFRFELPSSISGPIRLDPSDRPAVIEIASIRVVDVASEDTIWSAQNVSALRSLQLANTAMFLPQENSCCLLSYGTDPQVFLPPLQFESPARLEVSLRVEKDFGALSEALSTYRPESEEAFVSPTPASSGLLVQIYPFNESGYVEAQSLHARAEPGLWNTLEFELGAGAFAGPIRIDPADTTALVEIGEVEVVDLTNRRTILHLRDLPELSRILAIDSALFIPDDRRCLLFCFGPDPQLQLYPESDCANPVRLSLSFKFSPDLTPVADILKNVVLHGSGRTPGAELELVKSELRASQSARMLLAAELSQASVEKNVLIREKDEALSQLRERAEKLHEQLKAEREQRLSEQEELFRSFQEVLAGGDSGRLEREALSHSAREIAVSRDTPTSQRESLVRSFDALRTRINQTQAALDEERRILRSVEQSISWRVTKPMRSFMRMVRGGRSRNSDGLGS